MLFDMDLNELATQATNKQFQYEHNNFKNKEVKNSTALSFLETTQSGLTEFNTVLDSIRASSGGVVKNKAMVSAANMAEIKIKDYAAADSVSLFIQQLASAHEIALDGLDDVKIASETGVIPLKIGSQSLNIDFSKIDTVDQLANAINQHVDNNDPKVNDNLVNATVRRVNGQKFLVLKSNKTGEDNKIEFSATGVFTSKEITAAANAKVKLGGESSTVEITNSSNTFDDLINNAAITLTQAHKTGDTPLTINIAQDSNATEQQVNKFTEAFNAIQELVKFDKNNPNPYTSGLHIKINRLAIESIDGKRLTDFGFTFDKSGLLKVDNKKLLVEIEKDPTALNAFFNKKEGLIGKFDALLKPFLMGDKWSLDIEKTKLDNEKEAISELGANFDRKYALALATNLDKLKEMERVMEQMEGMLNMFDFEDKNK